MTISFHEPSTRELDTKLKKDPKVYYRSAAGGI
jgi:hypothetical protein